MIRIFVIRHCKIFKLRRGSDLCMVNVCTTHVVDLYIIRNNCGFVNDFLITYFYCQIKKKKYDFIQYVKNV